MLMATGAAICGMPMDCDNFINEDNALMRTYNNIHISKFDAETRSYVDFNEDGTLYSKPCVRP